MRLKQDSRDGLIEFRDKWTMYRYHVEDPVLLSLKATIAHGHGNVQSNDCSSAVDWYQTKPHQTFAAMLPSGQRTLSEANRSRRFRKTL